jgi:hypothetical protein
VIERSAVLPTDVVAVAELLVPSGSFVVAGADTVAVLLIVPVADAPTVPVAVNVAFAPLFRFTVVLMFPLPEAAPHVPAPVIAHVHVTPVTVAGKESWTVAPDTEFGPPFVTTIV